ncbi:RagB/SusD family nutrient uptake outer membrane protein [Mucilaginibacter sp. UR6-1]|uniref:RagB/SusD family nutrient uptake outer membrane protein n=1 Tax=Mucilaginibacter sp. UR6-1 TaxID=1435643 RepID=UPI001E4B4E25|nr:RagB/SusD family nutrient uptake outer membrane protein [Mucilaginibacter sp. UR6-1]MCC8407651.1 RagB/SusD family nutrient uptake outer membrane protein [Mucilaginibacter sp. UR6-1]
MKIQSYIILFVLSLSAASCQKYLDVEPRASISDEQTIFDKASAQTALNGVYSQLASGGYYSTTFQSIGYLSGDNIQWTGSQSQVQELINHNVSTGNATISGAWTAIYYTISRANHIIDKVPGVQDASFADADKNKILGEAYFIRALSYFDLARTWGAAPIITKPTNSPADNVGIGRRPVAEVYAQALNDLNAAEPLLTETTDRYRATRKTVWALKARFYLYQKDWAKAEEYATKLIGDNNYALVKPYSAFFANNVRGTQESVFEIFYSANELNNHRNQWQPQTNGGTRQWAPNDAFVALVNKPDSGGNRNVLVAQDNQGRWYGNLYYRTPAADPSFVIRIAELYLIRAEARAQLGSANDLIGARADLNAVRDRAGLAATTSTTQAALLLSIEQERRIEFALEPHRWFDLVRTGRAQAVLKIADPNKLLLPVPQEQIQIDPSLLPNNPGY